MGSIALALKLCFKVKTIAKGQEGDNGWRVYILMKRYKLSSKGIEPLMVFNQFFYREPPLPIGSPALYYILYIIFFY